LQNAGEMGLEHSGLSRMAARFAAGGPGCPKAGRLGERPDDPLRPGAGRQTGRREVR